MALSFMTRDQMAAALRELDQALYVHQQWSEGVHRVLLCRLVPDPNDLDEDAYRTCPFGTWYYGAQDGGLGQHPGFLALAVEHQHMHRAMTRILMDFGAGHAVTEGDYESFVGAMSRMRLEILNLSRELEDGIANLDPLTGATGRNGMLALLRRQQEVTRRTHQECLVAMMDLDLFKSVNDQYGHQAGDRVLVDVVRYVKTQLRPYDEFFRYGGEEFLLCAPFIDSLDALVMVERLREGISSLSIDCGEARNVNITASFGVTSLDPQLPIEESIARADRALYAAKAAGRNRSRTWDDLTA
jgi:diguanylate cyclase